VGAAIEEKEALVCRSRHARGRLCACVKILRNSEHVNEFLAHPIQDLVRVLASSVTSPALPLKHTAITIESVVTPSEEHTTSGVAAMADTGEGVLGALVGDVGVAMLELLVHDPHGGEEANVCHAAVVTEIGGSDVGDQGIREPREAAGTAGSHLCLEMLNCFKKKEGGKRKTGIESQVVFSESKN
jgi:hypothetical protein